MICFWLSSQIHIRTAKPVGENFLQLPKRNRFGAFVEIVSQHHLVIIQENGVNKRINQHLALRFPGNIHLSKPFKEKAELFFGNSRFFQLFNRDFVFEFIPRCFQLVQALFGRSCEDTLLNGCLLYTSRCV